MKLHKQLLFGVALLTLATIAGSCTDQIAVGNSFLDKAAGASVTEDTVFNNAEYTRQFLTAIYPLQYYGEPYRSSTSAPLSSSYWTGKFDALSDCYQLHFPNSTIFTQYYSSTFNANSGGGVYGYLTENVWVLVRRAYLLMENIDRVPGMDATEKAALCDEARCLIASGYFNMFRNYGGLPIITKTFTGTETSYNMPRATVEETVNFMVGLLDKVIQGGNLPWGYTGTDAQIKTGRWTKAGAMALKCQILQFAASPLFNDTKGYYGGTTEAETSKLVWYGGYKPELWTKCKQACVDFFTQLNANGIYALTQPLANTQEAYRYAYRFGYLNEASKEIVHSVRVSNNSRDSQYQWANLINGRNERYAYTPTQEYIEMFPWSDGKPFDWNATQRAGKLDRMFINGDTVRGTQDLQHRVLTRDPRLYETVCVNGVPQAIDWNSGVVSGNIYELWVGGSDAGTGPGTETGYYATGYGNNKYYAGATFYTSTHYPQWDVIRLSDLYLIYAEALLQADNDFTGALNYVDVVRARVGLGKLAVCNPDKNLTTNKANLLEEILRERACELGLEDTRYFDLVRYKRADRFGTQTHGLRMYRLKKDASSGKWVHSNDKWWNGDKLTDKTVDKAGFYEPTHFDFEKFPLTIRVREQWKNFDAKWYLQPFPQTEVNKMYGLVQNPGW